MDGIDAAAADPGRAPDSGRLPDRLRRGRNPAPGARQPAFRLPGQTLRGARAARHDPDGAGPARSRSGGRTERAAPQAGARCGFVRRARMAAASGPAARRRASGRAVTAISAAARRVVAGIPRPRGAGRPRAGRRDRSRRPCRTASRSCSAFARSEARRAASANWKRTPRPTRRSAAASASSASCRTSRSAAATRSSLRQSSVVFHTTAEAIVITDAARRIVAINAAFTRITGFGEAEALGADPDLLLRVRRDAGDLGRPGRRQARRLLAGRDPLPSPRRRAFPGLAERQRRARRQRHRDAFRHRLLGRHGDPRRRSRSSTIWRITTRSPACPTACCSTTASPTPSTRRSAAASAAC